MVYDNSAVRARTSIFACAVSALGSALGCDSDLVVGVPRGSDPPSNVDGGADASSWEVLARGEAKPGFVLAQGGVVAWVNRDTQAIRMASRKSDAGLANVDDAGAVGEVVLRAGLLYWNAGRAVPRMRLDGTGRSYIYENVSVIAPSGGVRLTANATHGFWYDKAHLYRADLAAQFGTRAPTGVAVVPTPLAWGGLASSPSNEDIYVGHLDSASGRLSVLRDGSLSEVTSTVTVPFSVAATASEIFWSEERGYIAKVPTSARNLPLSGHGVLADTKNLTGYVTVDAIRIYWTEPQTGRLLSCPKEACAQGGPDVVLVGMSGIYGISEDGDKIYFTVPEQGLVGTVQKLR